MAGGNFVDFAALNQTLEESMSRATAFLFEITRSVYQPGYMEME